MCWNVVGLEYLAVAEYPVTAWTWTTHKLSQGPVLRTALVRAASTNNDMLVYFHRQGHALLLYVLLN
jgi:hypothetical protein